MHFWDLGNFSVVVLNSVLSDPANEYCGVFCRKCIVIGNSLVQKAVKLRSRVDYVALCLCLLPSHCVFMLGSPQV